MARAAHPAEGGRATKVGRKPYWGVGRPYGRADGGAAGIPGTAVLAAGATMGVPAGVEAIDAPDWGTALQLGGTVNGPITDALPMPAVAAAPTMCAAGRGSAAAEVSVLPAVSVATDAAGVPLSPMKSVTLPNQLPGMKNAEEKMVSHSVALGPQLDHSVCIQGGTHDPLKRWSGEWPDLPNDRGEASACNAFGIAESICAGVDVPTTVPSCSPASAAARAVGGGAIKGTRRAAAADALA